MKLNDLLRFGMPQSIIDAWRSRQGDYLLPLQERAVRNGLLRTDDNNCHGSFLISAPTSAGKSFCGEMAAIDMLVKRRKAVMLVPLKSMAEEKYRYFSDCYASLGIRTLIVTGDHPENDSAFQRGEFDLAVAIYEKFNRLLTVNLDILRRIGLVIVDEVQMISEPERGPELELALSKVLRSGYGPRLVALSAVLDDGCELAEWLGCEIIKETVRPVDLLMGVAVDGSFRYRSFNSGFEGRENIDLRRSDFPDEGLIDFLKSDDAQKLVFLKSRYGTVEASRKMAASVKWPEAKETLAALDDEEPSCLVRNLRQVLSRGVAFHNADLTAGQRLAVEAGYRSGEIRVIFSTTTLAMGVNLPAETVLLETMKYSSGNYGTKPALVPISNAEFRNISGRAGRFGVRPGQEPGRAVIVAGSDFECDVLWNEYIDGGGAEQPGSALTTADLPDIVLDLIACGFGRDRDSLEKCLGGLFYCRQIDGFDSRRLDAVIGGLVDDGFIRSSLRITPPGKVVAESGISTASARYYRQCLAKRYPGGDIGWLFLAVSAPDFDTALSGLDGREYRGRVYEKLLHRDFDEYAGELDALSGVESGREQLDFETAARLKAALLLSEWGDGSPVDRLEQRYQLGHGQIVRLAEGVGWLLAAIGRMLEADDSNCETARRLGDLVFRMQFGVDPAMRDIFFAADNILNRHDYKSLHESGIISPVDLQQAGEEYLQKLLGSRRKVAALMEKLKYISKEDKMNRNKHKIEAGFNPSLIELDGGYEKERYLVKVDGFPVRLTGKSFKYLAKLAFSRLIKRDGWVYKDDIEAGFNQARYLYRLKQELKAGGVSSPLFENNRLGYYRLALEPSKIRLNISNFKNHYDFELRDMADQLALKAAS